MHAAEADVLVAVSACCESAQSCDLAASESVLQACVECSACCAADMSNPWTLPACLCNHTVMSVT